MRWIQDEQQKRANDEKKRQAEARKFAAKQFLDSEKLKKENQRYGIQEMEWFAYRVKKSLPQGVSIIQQFYDIELPEWMGRPNRYKDVEDSDESVTSSHALLKIDLGDGVELELVDKLMKWATINAGWNSGLTRGVSYKVYIFKAGEMCSLDAQLAIVSSNNRGKISKQAMKVALFDAYQLLA